MPHSKYPVKFKLAVVQEILSSQGRIQVARAPKGLHPRIQAHLRWLEKELKKVHDQIDTALQNHPALLAESDLLLSQWAEAHCLSSASWRKGFQPLVTPIVMPTYFRE